MTTRRDKPLDVTRASLREFPRLPHGAAAVDGGVWLLVGMRSGDNSVINPKVSRRQRVAAVAAGALALAMLGVPASAHADTATPDPAASVQADASTDPGADAMWACDDAAGTPDQPQTCATEPNSDPAPEPLGTLLRRGPGPDSACDYYLYYNFTHRRGAKTSLYHSTALNDDVTINVTITKGDTVTGTVGGSGDFSISGLVWSAKQTVSASLAYAKSSSYSSTVNWKVPHGHKLPARLDVGAQSIHTNWAHLRQNGNCTATVIGSGTDTLPDDVPVFWHN